MLVLSRKTDQKIIFPNLGVSLKLLSVRGSLAKIGIEAPDDLPIFREELVEGLENVGGTPYVPRELRHELRNGLNTIRLAVELFQRQMEAGLADKAQSTFLKLVHQLESLDHQFGGSKTPAVPAAKQQPPSRVLVVDDDTNERELLAGLLQLSGWEVATAGDGDEALEYLSSHVLPKFVLMDMRMPRCNGFEAICRIRGNPDWADVTVFAVSGTSPAEAGVELGYRGINRWFTKPLNPVALLQEMSQLPA
jgi:two-component system, OmpR family, response regulator